MQRLRRTLGGAEVPLAPARRHGHAARPLDPRRSSRPAPDYEQREDGVLVGRDVQASSRRATSSRRRCSITASSSATTRSSAASIVGPGSVVGFGSEVARSYLGEGVELHHNYVGDSVMDHELDGLRRRDRATTASTAATVPMFAGSERVDTGRMKLGLMLGADARIGVNTSTMPGVKIGAGAILDANLRVTRDLPDGARSLNERRLWTFLAG